MGIDKSLGDNHPSVIIDGTKYHYGREPVYGQYLVENANVAKDYWCFQTRKDLVAFLVNLPKSADPSFHVTLHPDWQEVTHEQRLVYFAEDLARLRVLAAAKLADGTARTFNMDLEGREGPHAPQRLEGASTAAVTPREAVHDSSAKLVERRIAEKAAQERAVGREEGRGPSPEASRVEGRRERPKQEHGPKPRLKKGHGQGL
jgi:hypothetical protein